MFNKYSKNKQDFCSKKSAAKSHWILTKCLSQQLYHKRNCMQGDLKLHIFPHCSVLLDLLCTSMASCHLNQFFTVTIAFIAKIWKAPDFMLDKRLSYIS